MTKHDISQRVIVVGGGFGGVKAALELAKRGSKHITLISDEKYFLHHATLYATATGKSMAESVIPLQAIFAPYPMVSIVRDTALSLDPERKILIGKKAQYQYDKLVLALGSVTTYFNIKGMEKHAFGIKTLDDIKQFQKHIHNEVVDKKLDKELFVIGAGPTGVELAGALNEYVQSLIQTYRLKQARSKVTLVEAAPHILPKMSKWAAEAVKKRLKRVGIRTLEGRKVAALADDTITIDKKQYSTSTAIWTSGVTNNPFFTKHPNLFHMAINGRVNVNPHLEALPNVYVIGDNNTVKYSGTAWPALHQATFVAKQITRLQQGKSQQAFRPRSAPTGLPVGEGWGYVEWHGLYVAGRAGYLLRRYMELYGYCQLVPLATALPIWRAHYLANVEA